MSDLKGKRCLVTGAGAGTGRQIALHLSSLGVEVYALGRTQAKLQSLQEQDPKIKTICCDLADWDATRKAVQPILPIPFLVNNAGIYRFESLSTAKKEDIMEMFAINILAPINLTQLVTNDLIARKMKGSIVGISCDCSFIGYGDAISYNISKAALDALTRSAVAEMSRKGIRYNTINPNFLMTDMGKKLYEAHPVGVQALKKMIPLDRIVETQDVAQAVAFMLSEEQSAMINGHHLPLSGGLQCCRLFPE